MYHRAAQTKPSLQAVNARDVGYDFEILSPCSLSHREKSLYRCFEEEWVYSFSCVRASVRNQYFPSQFYQQACITATSILVWSYRSLT